MIRSWWVRRRIETLQENRPSGVPAPPTGKLPSATTWPWGRSTRPLGRLRELGPAFSSWASAAAVAPSSARAATARARVRRRTVPRISVDHGDVESAVGAKLDLRVVGVVAHRTRHPARPAAARSRRRRGGARSVGRHEQRLAGEARTEVEHVGARTGVHGVTDAAGLGQNGTGAADEGPANARLEGAGRIAAEGGGVARVRGVERVGRGVGRGGAQGELAVIRVLGLVDAAQACLVDL